MEQTFATMKRFAALVMIAVTIAGCQKAPESTPIRGGGAAPRANGEAGGQSTTQSGIALNGFVWSNNETLFNEMVKEFMSGSLDPQYVGWVSATAQNNTGVFIGGRVSLANGAAIQAVNNGQSTQLNPASELVVMVFDYVPNQSPAPAPLPPTYFKQLDPQQSYINGNSAKLHFYDGRGFVEMTGTFDGQYFQGDFYISTDVNFQGQQGGAGNLGSFKVPTCQFFRCQ